MAHCGSHFPYAQTQAANMGKLMYLFDRICILALVCSISIVSIEGTRSRTLFAPTQPRDSAVLTSHACNFIFVAQLTRSYPNSYLFPGSPNVKLSWNITENGIFQGALEATASGWAAFGLSPRSFSMGGADIMLQYVSSSGNPTIGDYSAAGDFTPAYDTTQNWEYVAGGRVGPYFSR